MKTIESNCNYVMSLKVMRRVPRFELHANLKLKVHGADYWKYIGFIL